MIERHEQNQWEYVPGLLQLMEEGVDLDDLATRQFVAPQVRGTGLAAPELTPAEHRRLSRIWDWLKGFRRDSTLCERRPIWIPIAQAWPAPGGSLEFSYTASAARDAMAEISVFPLAGLGGASRRQLTSSVTIPAEDRGIAYEARAFLTVYRYVNQQTGVEIPRVDVDCANEEGNFQSRDLDLQEHPLQGMKPTLEELRAGGYTVSRIEHGTERQGEISVTLSEEGLRSWKVSIGTDLPVVGGPIKLGATCQRSKTFATKFTLPGGHDYAFIAPKDETPIVPLCVALRSGDISRA